jgi:hypothetical protein
LGFWANPPLKPVVSSICASGPNRHTTLEPN